MRHAASAVGATKNTASPIVLTTRPPVWTALDQAADSNLVSARLCSRKPIVWAHRVEPTRSTKPSATTSTGPSTLGVVRGVGPAADGLGSALRPSEVVHDDLSQDGGHLR